MSSGPNDPTRPGPEDETQLPGRSVPAAADTRIGPYRLLERVGEGGMGEVWLAEQEAPLRRRVALKLIKRGLDTEHVIARFDGERQALARMDHPAIAQVYDAGETHDGRPFFAMEYVAGEPLNAYCDRQRRTTRERLELFVRVCDGVEHAHHKGVVHRDLKPTNILVTERDGAAVPKIIDFGVAKAIGGALTDHTVHTAIGGFVGTLEYMSPEQAEISGMDIDTRADVYSLGVVLYELLTGTLPFDSESLRQGGFDGMRRLIRETEPPRPSMRLTGAAPATAEAAARRRSEPRALVRTLRGDLDWITMKALEKERSRRYQSPALLAADIRRHLDDEAVLAGPPSVTYRARKFVRRHRVSVAAAGVALAALVGFSVYVTVQNRKVRAERDRANAIAKFLTDAFRVSDPSASRGRTVTAREILDGAAERLATELAAQPELRGRLGATIGHVYGGLGLHEDAERLLKPSIEALAAVRGRDDPETLRAVNDLGVAYYESGRPKEAAEVHRENLERRRRALGSEHPETLDSIGNLANALQALGNVVEAERLQRELLEVRRRVKGPNDLDTVRTLNNLASALQVQGRYAESADLFAEAWRALRETQGPDHPDALLVGTNVATLKALAGDPAGAVPIFVECLEGQRRVLGPDHPETIRTWSDLGDVLRSMGRFPESETELASALDVSAKRWGDAYPLTLRVMHALMRLRAEDGNTAGWRAIAVRRLAALRSVAELPDAGAAAKNRYSYEVLTIEPADLRDPESALAFALAANELAGQADPDILDTLALAWLRNGDRAKAEGAIRRALDLLPADAPTRPDFDARLAEILAQPR